MKTAFIQAFVMFAIAFGLSMAVALMIKGLFVAVRRFSSK